MAVPSVEVLFSARQALAMDVFPDAIALTKFLTQLASGVMSTPVAIAATCTPQHTHSVLIFATDCIAGGAIMEFLLNPIFGKLSDTYGRKAIIPLGSYASLICRGLVFAMPKQLWSEFTIPASAASRYIELFVVFLSH